MNLKKALIVVCISFCGIQIGMTQTNTFPNSGHVGIGTSSPLAKLDVRGGILVKNLLNVTGETIPMISQSLSFGNYIDFGTSINTFTESEGINSYALQFFTKESYLTAITEKMRISAVGNVGIGVTNPLEKLSVNGNIRAREIKVETANWPDYVFRPDYELKPLSEVSKFIKENGHLPEVPKAAVVEEEGVSLGEMNKVLLKKVEELTLHLIRIEREMERLKEKVNKN